MIFTQTQPSFSLSIRRSEPDLEPRQSPVFLSPEDNVLYTKIVYRLLQIYRERYVHPNTMLASPSSKEKHISALIFRESKSWKTIENEFLEIRNEDDSTQEIKDRANAWIDRIARMRVSQQLVRDSLEKMNRKRKNLCSENGQSVLEREKEIGDLKSSFKEQRSIISTCLEEGKIDIDLMIRGPYSQTEEQKTKQSQKFFDIIQKIDDYWYHLNVFSDLPEISLDDETMTTQVKPLDNPKDQLDKLEKCLNQSTQYIFTIEEKNSEITPLQYSDDNGLIEPGSIVRPTGIGLHRVMAYNPPPSDALKSPKQKEISPRKMITDESLSGSGNPEEKTYFKITRIVELALRHVNETLTRPRTPNTPTDFVNQCFIHFLT